MDELYKIFALGTALVFFWILESVWRHDKRWLIPIVIFPPTIFLFVFNYWEETRGKCFFAALLFAMMLLVGGVVGFSFFEHIMHIIKIIAFWPYYALIAMANFNPGRLF